VNDILPGDNAARARYATLTTALGGEPLSGFHRAVLARLAAWTDADDIGALAAMIRERVDHQTSRYRDLIGEVAHHLEVTHPASAEGWVYTAMPTVLAALIREATRDTEGDASWPTTS
jgi:hypothetical protein